MSGQHPAGYVGHDSRGHFVHYCHCGKWASFGYGVRFKKGEPPTGKWFCGDHRQEGPVPVIVTLSEVWRNRAREAALEAHARAAPTRGRGLGRGPDPSANYDITGCLAEAAVAKHFQLPWKWKGRKHGDIDVGGLIEVRGRPVPGPGPDLPFNKMDKDHLPYVLAHVWTTDNTIRLIGWLYGHEGKSRPELWDDKCRCYWVPPPYRPISELMAIIRP